MKYSKQRELILQTLQENMIHPTAEQLFKLVRQKDPTVSLATVYRNLNLLSENGTIKKINGLEEMSHFDHNLIPHHHFICKKCRKVFDIYQSFAIDTPEKCLQDEKFKIEECEIFFRGICQECQDNN